MNTINTPKIRKGTFVRVNIPILKYSTIPDGGYLPTDTIYQVIKVSRKNPNTVRIHNKNLCGNTTVNVNNCTVVDNPNKIGVKVGDIYSAHWGYGQSNVDYYMVVRVTKNSANLAPLPATRKYDGPMHGTVSPVLKNPSELGDGKLHRIKYTSNGTPCFRLNSYSHAYPCQPDDTAFFSDWH